jgi:hypothetical protein
VRALFQKANASSSDGVEQRSKRAEPLTDADHELELRLLLESVEKSRRGLRRRKRVAALAGELHSKIEEYEDAAFEEVSHCFINFC